MKKLIVVVTMVLATVLLPACGSGAPAAGTVNCTYDTAGTAAKKVALPPTKGVVNTGTAAYSIGLNADQVAVTLDRVQAPCTVNSFGSLAGQGFFDATSCHRLVNGSGLFVLQCGDPTGTGSGGPGYQFADELSGKETYPAGTLAMANAGAGTNGSQFFIVYEDSQLPPKYTVFGHTDAAGIAVVAKIAAGGQDGSNPDGTGKPLLPAVITGVTPR